MLLFWDNSPYQIGRRLRTSFLILFVQQLMGINMLVYFRYSQSHCKYVIHWPQANVWTAPQSSSRLDYKSNGSIFRLCLRVLWTQCSRSHVFRRFGLLSAMGDVQWCFGLLWVVLFVSSCLLPFNLSKIKHRLLVGLRQQLPLSTTSFLDTDGLDHLGYMDQK